MSTPAKPIALTPELADELFRASFPNRIPAIKALRARCGHEHGARYYAGHRS